MVKKGVVASRTSNKRTSAQGDSEKTKKRLEKKPRKRHWLRIVVGVLLALLLVLVAVFSWDRWLRFDDAQDVQGEWTVAGQAMTVIIDANEIALTNDVGYAYTLNTWDKTIVYTFGKLQGSGTYQFSEDRQTLVIVEGGTPDLFTDLKRRFGIEPDEIKSGSTLATVLTKITSTTDGTPQDLTNNSTDEADAAGKALDAATDSSEAKDNGDAAKPDGSNTANDTETKPEDKTSSGTSGSGGSDNSAMAAPSDNAGPKS